MMLIRKLCGPFLTFTVAKYPAFSSQSSRKWSLWSKNSLTWRRRRTIFRWRSVNSPRSSILLRIFISSNIFKAIILCGGLAESKHIQTQLREWCKDNLDDAEVIIPDEPWPSICRGAAMSEVKSSNFVKNRRARRSYGVLTHVPFIEEEHEERVAGLHPQLGKRAYKYFWHIKRVRP